MKKFRFLLVAAAADILLLYLGKRAEKAEPKKEVADRV